MWGAIIGAGLIGIGNFVGDLIKSKTQKDIAETVSAETATQAIELEEKFKPYTEAGALALQEQQALMGLSGDEAQQTAIDKIQASPEFGAMTQQGESAILANASATGGLRGGNTQAALSQFRPQVLNSLINQRMGQLGGLVGIGQSSTAGVGNAVLGLQQQALGAETNAMQAAGNKWGNIPGSLAYGYGLGSAYDAGQVPNVAITQPGRNTPTFGGGGGTSQFTQGF
jgi:hypothetical protein